MAMNKHSPKDRTTPEKIPACRPTPHPVSGRAQARVATPPAKPPVAFAQTIPAPAATRVGSSPPQASREELSCLPSAPRRLAGRLRPTACVGRAQAPAKPPSALPTNHPAPAATRVGSSSPRASREELSRHPQPTRRLAGRLRPTIFVSSWFRASPHPKTIAEDGPFRRKQPNRRNRYFRSQEMALTNLTPKGRTMSENIQVCRLAGQRVTVTPDRDGQAPWSNLAGN